MKYNPQKVEQKWAKVWERKRAWKVDLKKAKKPYYNLMMFPYPSAEGLHVGNVYAFTGSDIHGRFRRMQGYDVFEPMGFDSFGIHSENFAIKQGTHPKTQTAKNIKNFTKQLSALGALFDWDKAVTTSEPEYYKWTQWLFLQLYKAGLAYRAKAPVDWCPSCKTVLADEQVIDGKCERCESQVLQKELEQWFFRITKYADRLLKNLETIDWSERTKIAQKNWIGKKEGADIRFKIKDLEFAIEVFTTRPDTLFGATFLVLAPEHPLVEKILKQVQDDGTRKEIKDYVEQAKKKSEQERIIADKEKTGVFTGIYAINPVNQERVPVWVADYALMQYGTGALFGDAHDERDVAFARKYGLPLKPTLKTGNAEVDKRIQNLEECFTGEGILVGSGEFTGLTSAEAKKKIVAWLVTKGDAQAKITYHLRDWLISRQRYWGPPIPITYCKQCGTVPVPEKDLPVKLPAVKDFRPTGTGKSPLASVASFVKTKCPQCKSPAERETDVSDTFLDSAWYFFRYPSVGEKNSKLEIRNLSLEIPWNQQVTRQWLPVDMYIGGQEHAVLHLLYTRFITMALKDLGFIDFEEPFKKFRAHGLLTKDGAKMSKSKGNVVNPDEYFKKYGADTVRMYLMFIGPFSEGGDWSDKGIVGIYRFLNRVWEFVQKAKTTNKNSKVESLRHKTIKKVTEDLENLRYNTAIAALMEYFNEVSKQQTVNSKQDIETLLVLLAPFAPYITEELFPGVHNLPWPTYDPKLTKEAKIRLVVQVNGKVRDILEVSASISEAQAKDYALTSEKIQKWIQGKPVKKTIYVKGRLVNIVA